MAHLSLFFLFYPQIVRTYFVYIARVAKGSSPPAGLRLPVLVPGVSRLCVHSGDAYALIDRSMPACLEGLAAYSVDTGSMSARRPT